MTSPSTPMPQAVLWDLDGTLIDSEPLWMSSESALMHAHGLGWTQADALSMVGNSLPASAAHMRSMGLPLGEREIIDHLIGQVLAGLKDEVPWRPGARELLQGFRELGVPQALVTMSETPMAQAVLAGMPDDPFDVIVTGDVVEHGKPHPEPYLTALARLNRIHGGITAEGSLALEDSLPGTTSALAAGVVTVGVPLHVALAERDGLILVPSLANVTPQDLGCLVALATTREAKR